MNMNNSFVVPETVTTLKGEVKTVVELGPNLFDFSPYREIILPKTVRKINWCFYSCRYLLDIFVHPENQHFKDIDGVLFTKDAAELVAFPNARTGEYFIPEGTECISHFAFKTSHITTLHIPASVKEIGINAFYDCRLSDIYLDGRNNLDDI